MPNIIYYVASSLDGFIAGPGEDISRFVPGGDGVERYLHDLKAFNTVIMGRKTYEFGYQYGLQPGKKAYPHMDHFIVSNHLELPDAANGAQVLPPTVKKIEEIRDRATTDIYLCGGGQFAGWLLENKLIDELHLKLNPIILGGGTPLFGQAKVATSLTLKAEETYEKGFKILRYTLNYQ